jgi:sulfite exporter TauE/SafE
MGRMDTLSLASILSLLGLGLLLGLEHALDADHVVAVSTLVSQTKSIKRSSLFGVFWGLGHTTTLFVVGLLILVFKLAIPPRLALSFEFLVGVMLVALGLDVLRKVWREDPHIHTPQHEDGVTHTHLHSHADDGGHHHQHRSFLVGLVHGLAGSSALMLLVLTTVDSVWLGVIFILVFGAGTIVGMLITSTLIALPFKWMTNFAGIDRILRLAAGVISVGLGVVIMIRIGFINGLFL